MTRSARYLLPLPLIAALLGGCAGSPTATGLTDDLSGIPAPEAPFDPPAGEPEAPPEAPAEEPADPPATPPFEGPVDGEPWAPTPGDEFID